MESVECSEDGKTITVTYATPFADWQSVFSGQVPAHVIEREAGVDDLVAAFQSDDRAAIEAIANTYNTLYTVNPGEINPDTMLSGGRLAFGSWEAGVSFTLVPNENYWGTPAASDEIVVRYIAEEAQAQALANGEINAMDPQPTPDLLGQLEGIDNAVVETGSQYIWEHFDFNFNIPALQDIRVREAFAKCLPRQQIVDNLIKPLDPTAEVLNNRWIQPFEDGYQDNSGGVSELDIEGAQALLAEAGQEGLQLRIGWFDNGGNQRRTDQVALTIESCNQAGFEVVDAGSETFFDVELAAGDWDIAMFAWAGSPLKSGGVSTYQAGAGNNVGNIAIPELDPLLNELLASPDPAVQIDLANQIDTILWENIATIPVFSFPGVVAYTDNVSNVIYNPSQNGLTFNASEWQIA
jgi:peptide/nickel transport system substrate-binding protein